MPRNRLAIMPGLVSFSLLAIAVAGCGAGTSTSGPSGVYVPKHPDSPMVFIEKFDFQSGNKVAVTTMDNTAAGTYVLADGGAVEITMPGGHKAHLKDVGGGCLVAATDPGITELAAKDGVDVNELGRYCRG